MEIDIPRLVEYDVRLDITSVVKRLGWALEAFGAPADVLAPLRSHLAKGDSPLDPGPPVAAIIRPGTSARTCTMAENKTLMLRPLRLRIAAAARTVSKPQFVVEKDHAPIYLPASSAVVSEPRESVLFKGGTCLRKAHLPGYRFSEDLDFTARLRWAEELLA